MASHHRLDEAADYFDSQIAAVLQDLAPDPAFLRMKDLIRRVSANLQFLVYEVESMADVGVILETLNDRGQPLSELEKSKNYLLYLARQVEPTKLGEDLAKHINSSWATIFANLADLGSEAEDQLLRAHWLATRDPDPRTWKGVASIKKLFDRGDYVPGSVRLRPGTSSHDDHDVESKWRQLDQDVRTYASQLAQCSQILRESVDPHATYGDYGAHASEVGQRAASLMRTGVVAGYRPLVLAMRLRHPGNAAWLIDLLRLCECYSTRVVLIMRYPYCYAKSSLKKEQELAAYEAWTPDAVRLRLNRIADWAMKRWSVESPAEPVLVVDEPDAPEFEDETEPDLSLKPLT